MIKLFISHVCGEKSHAFADYIAAKIKKDIRQCEPFIACKSRDWRDASDLNLHIDESHFLIVVITDEYIDRPNCRAELARARKRKKTTGNFPVILPLKFNCTDNTLKELEFSIDQAASKGEKWIDFTATTDWEIRYEEFHEQILSASLKYKLLGDEDFYQDIEHLDLILKRNKPTSSEIELAIRFCKKGEEYGNYFFRKLKAKDWIWYLKPYDFFRRNPAPVESEKQTGLYLIPHWPVLDYLERISKECSGIEDRQYAEELMQIIRSVTRASREEKADNYKTYWYFVKIMANLPVDIIKLDDIRLVEDWVDSRFKTGLLGRELGKTLLPKLLQNTHDEDLEKAERLIDIVSQIKWVERSYDENGSEKVPQSAIYAFELDELFRKNLILLGEKCGKKVVEILTARLQEVTTDKNNDYSYIWRPAIEDHAQNHSKTEIKQIIISALRDVLLSYAKNKNENAVNTIRTLLSDKLHIIKRTALYAINMFYDSYHDLFWSVLDHEMFNINLQHELFALLKKHFRDFTEVQKNRTIDMMDALTGDLREGTDKSMPDADLRLTWLQAIRGEGSDRGDRLYEKYLRIVKHPKEHPEFPSYTVSFVGEVSPRTTEELLNMSISEIVSYLESFRESGYWGAPTEEGLAEILKDAVKQKPDKFEGHLPAFLKVKETYQYVIIRAFESLWSEKKIIDWEKVLSFCQLIVLPDEFWQQDKATSGPARRAAPSRISSAISDLIRTGVHSDEWAFDEKLLPIAEKIVLRILQKEISTASGGDGDALNEAINTPRGRCVEALFSYSLRQARIADKRDGNHDLFWQHIQPVFDQELEKCKNTNLEFSALAGNYVPNLNYLSKNWLESNTDFIFSKKYETNWRCAMHGFAYVNRFWSDIYTLLKSHGHFKKSLKIRFENAHVREKVVEFISSGYLRGLETLAGEESLFSLIVEDWRREDIADIISFFWMHRDEELDDLIRERILAFWKLCHDKIKGKEADNVLILSDLNLLAVFLNEIQEERKDLLLQSAPYVDENHHSYLLLEYLDRLANQNPTSVAEIYLKMLSRVVPDDDKGFIRSIVKKLYKAGLKAKANSVCDKYAREGHVDLLKDLHERYGYG